MSKLIVITWYEHTINSTLLGCKRQYIYKAHNSAGSYCFYPYCTKRGPNFRKSLGLDKTLKSDSPKHPGNWPVRRRFHYKMQRQLPKNKPSSSKIAYWVFGKFGSSCRRRRNRSKRRSLLRLLKIFFWSKDGRGWVHRPLAFLWSMSSCRWRRKAGLLRRHGTWTRFEGKRKGPLFSENL